MHRLDLQPARAAPPGLVRRGQRLGHHALVPGGQGALEEGLRRIGIGGDKPLDAAARPGRSRPASRPLARPRRVEQIASVEMQHVEEEGRAAAARPRRADVDAAAEARRGDLERVRPADPGAARSPRRRRPACRHGRASTASTTSGSRAVMSSRLRVKIETSSPVAVDLHPGAVELGLERLPRRRAGRARRRLDGASAPASARPAAPTSSRNPRKRAPRRRSARRRRPPAGRRAASPPGGRRPRDAGRLGDRVGHHAEQRTLPQLTAEQPTQEQLLPLGRGGEQVGDAARRRRACDPAPAVGRSR